MKAIQIIIAAMLVGCMSKRTDLPKIYLNQVTGYDDNGEVKRMDSLYAFPGSEYFELTLNSVSNGQLYVAGKELIRPQVNRDFYSKDLDVVDSLGAIIHFKSSADFLNYMSRRGYEMMDQKQARYHTDYTFKRSKN